VLGLVGESGSGKTTIARCLVGLVRPDAGRITAFGTDVSRCSAEELRRLRRRMQVVYQDPYSSLNPRMSIGEAVGEAARVHGLVTRATEGQRVNELLELVGLPTKVARWLPRELSGGQRQRAAIARALAVKPDVVIADEAVSALDVSVQAQVLNLFADLTQQLGISMVFITHQLSVIAHVADRVAVMLQGRVVEQGTVEDIFLRPAHPYTVGLLRAVPSIGRQRSREAAIAGDPSVRERLGTGCRFRLRCPMAQAVCESQDPAPVFLGGEHFAACHLLPQGYHGSATMRPGATLEPRNLAPATYLPAKNHQSTSSAIGNPGDLS
jgi:oligopeptide/dipeptide ABC transporter ATP-binding protein